MLEKPRSVWSRLPSFVWIFIFIGGIAALFGGIIGLFWLLTNVEGAASIIMLLAGLATIRGASAINATPAKWQGLMVGGGILFFALMGLAIDQTGNYFYNRPMQWFYCPEGTELKRGIEVTNPVPGQTNVSQEFTCVNPVTKRLADTISTGELMLVRFGEYLVIGYVLVWLNRLYGLIRRSRSAADVPLS